VSKPERRADMYVSTLQSFLKATGGELKITARFPEGTVELNQFEDVGKVAGRRIGCGVGSPHFSQGTREMSHQAGVEKTCSGFPR